MDDANRRKGPKDLWIEKTNEEGKRFYVHRIVD
jgi:hypothetical protein